VVNTHFQLDFSDKKFVNAGMHFTSWMTVFVTLSSRDNSL